MQGGVRLVHCGVDRAGAAHYFYISNQNKRTRCEANQKKQSLLTP